MKVFDLQREQYNYGFTMLLNTEKEFKMSVDISNYDTKPAPTAPSPPVPVSTPKPGWQSTEFATTLVAAIALASGAIPERYAPIAAAIAGLYVACRTALKMLHVSGFAKNVPDLPALPPGSTKTTIEQVPK